MPSKIRNLLRSSSNASSNKENSLAVDVSPKSLTSNSSPKGDSLEAQLERKTKECETAKKLIDMMKISRTKDESTIAELRSNEESVRSKADELDSEIESLRSQLAEKESEIAGKQAETAALTETQQREVEALSSKVSFAEHQVEAVKAQYESRLEQISSQVTAAKSEREGLRSSLESRVKELEKLVNERDMLKSELGTVSDRIASTTAELDSLRSRKAADESRLQAELKKTHDALNKSAEEKGTLQWQLDKEKEVASKKVKQLEQQVADQVDIISRKDGKIAQLEQEIASVKKADESAKHEAVRKLRLAEAKHIEAEEALTSLKKQFAETKISEASMREEVEQLIQQQSSAIDKISASNNLRDLAEKANRDAQDKLKQVTVKLGAVEKQLKVAEDQTAELKKDIDEKCAAIKQAEIEATKNIDAEKHKTQNVAIITSVAVLVLSRLIFS